MSRRDELAKGIQKTTEPMADQKQVYPSKQPSIPSRSAVAVKSTKSMKVLPMGLEVQAKVDETEWQEMGEQLAEVEGKLPYYWGDWLNSGNFEWGAYKRFAAQLGQNWRTIEDYAYICRNVHLSCRHEKLSLSHHKVVAPLYDEEDKERTRELQRSLLQYAVENNLNKDDFRYAVSQVIEGTPETADPALPDTAIEAASIQIVMKRPYWEAPFHRLRKNVFKRWDDTAPEDRQELLKELKALLKELERMG